MQTNGYADEVGVLLHLCRDRFTIDPDQSPFSLPEFEVWLRSSLRSRGLPSRRSRYLHFQTTVTRCKNRVSQASGKE